MPQLAERNTTRKKGSALMSFADMEFVYEPYPIGFARPVFDEDFYEELLRNWPETPLFKFMPEYGAKYSLSELNHPNQYHAFVKSAPVWLEFYRWVKSQAFFDAVICALADNHLDVGLAKERLCIETAFSPWFRRAWAGLRKQWRTLVGHKGILRTRLEFSMLPAYGGAVRPHTDGPAKVITLVISMAREGEWDPAWGGGTFALRPKDITRNYNQMNKMGDLKDYDPVRCYDFAANQCVLFIKTWNSHHGVYSMIGPRGDVFRRTLTINIERVIA